MRVSFVLRVDAERLANGQLLGEIEEVATGRIGALTGFADIQPFCVDLPLVAKTSEEGVVE